VTKLDKKQSKSSYYVLYLSLSVIIIAVMVFIALSASGGRIAGKAGGIPKAYSDNLNLSIINSITGSAGYQTANSSVYNIGNSSDPVYQSTSLFLYSNHTNSTPSAPSLPQSIASIIIYEKSSAAAYNALIGVLFGARPLGSIGGYIQNSSSSLENSAYTYKINGTNLTFYNIYLNTNSSGLPLYRNTTISPPVYQYETAFQYGKYVCIILSTSPKPLPNGQDISLKLSEALASSLANGHG
jgi:hypothetical protein